MPTSSNIELIIGVRNTNHTFPPLNYLQSKNHHVSFALDIRSTSLCSGAMGCVPVGQKSIATFSECNLFLRC